MPPLSAPPVPPSPARPRRHWARYLILAGAVFALTLTGVLALRGGLPGVHAKPLTCRQKYQAWRTGPAKAEGAKMITVLNAFQPAATSEDLPAMQTGLRQAGEAARQLEAYPVRPARIRPATGPRP